MHRLLSTLVLGALATTLAACGHHAPPPAAPGSSSEDSALEGNDPDWPAGTPHKAAVAVEGTAASTSGEKLVAEVTRELKAMTSTRYRHKTNVDEDAGLFEFDCSGFVSYALRSALPDAYAAVPAGPKGRARAEDFTLYFASLSADVAGGAFARVTRVSDLRAGDIVAWTRPADVEGTNTGHVAIVLDMPKNVGANEVAAGIGGAVEWLVPVADSTESPHAADARGKSTTTGLGTGTIGLVTDTFGTPLGYRWKGGQSASAHATTVAMARPR